jgi:uncharacterized protein YceK
MMRIMMVVLSFILLTGCGSVETNQSKKEPQGDKSVIIDLETKLEANQLEDKVVFDLTLANVGSEDMELLFSSGQQFEIIVKNEENQEVYRYSDGKMFTQALQTKLIKAGKHIAWSIEWDQKTDGKLVPNEEYTVMAEVLAQPGDEAVTIQTEQLQISKSMTIENVDMSQEEETEVKDETGSDEVNIEDLENKAFRGLKVEGEYGEYTVTGEARVFEAVFGYSVSDGYQYYIEDFKQLNEGAPSWSPFTIEISISEEQLPVNGTVMLELYEESAKDGSKVNQLFVPLERIVK